MINWPQEPACVKYKLKYEKFILVLKNRILPENEYFEIHHILPRSLGGTDDKDNLIKLTAREHYIAHAMLLKMKFQGVYHSKMAYAFCTFLYGFKHKKHKESYKFSSRLYEVFKKKLSEAISSQQSGEGNPFYGKKHSRETKDKIRAYRKGKKLEEIFSPEQVENIRLANKNRVIREESKLKRKAGQKQYWSNKENKEKRSLQTKKQWEDPNYKEKMRPYIEARKGVPRDPKIIEKGLNSKKLKKEQGISYYSDEGLKNIREAAKNRVVTEEQRQRQRETNKKRFTGVPKSEEHKRKLSESIRKTKAAKKAAGCTPVKRSKIDSK